MSADVDRIDLERETFAGKARPGSLRRFITGGPMRGTDGLPIPGAGAVAGAWDILEPDTPLAWGYALDAICEFLEAATFGQIQNGLIEAPPRIAKSRIVSQAWPAWCWALERDKARHAKMPLVGARSRWIGASHTLDLAMDNAVFARDIMRHQWYRERWGHLFGFVGDQDVKSSYRNTARGERRAVSVATNVTGKGGDAIVVDDPIDADDAYNDRVHDDIEKWWTKKMPTRLNDPKHGVRMVVMQRFHSKDLAGVCRALGYDVLTLPMRFNPKSVCVVPAIGYRDPRTVEGEVLFPERIDAERVADLAKTLGPHSASAQLDQNPMLDEGQSRFPASRWARWKDLPRNEDGTYRRPDERLTSWDTTFKGKTATQKASSKVDYVVGTLWYRYGETYYLIDRCRGQWGFNECCRQMVAFLDRVSVKWPFVPTMHLIETKANGEAIIDEFKAASIDGRRALSGCVGFDPSPYGDKESRAYSLEGIIYGHNVLIPESASWLGDPDKSVEDGGWLTEWQSFPEGKNDDSVDSGSQALIYMRRRKRVQIR